jgi:hypothetical protein
MPIRNAPIANFAAAENDGDKPFFKADTYGHSKTIDRLKALANQMLPVGLCFCEARAEATV